jgi:hypothetical protein
VAVFTVVVADEERVDVTPARLFAPVPSSNVGTLTARFSPHPPVRRPRPDLVPAELFPGFGRAALSGPLRIDDAAVLAWLRDAVVAVAARRHAPRANRRTAHGRGSPRPASFEPRGRRAASDVGRPGQR